MEIGPAYVAIGAMQAKYFEDLRLLKNGGKYGSRHPDKEWSNSKPRKNV
jgi:hypothetical protein